MVLATGARYRRLEVANLDAFELTSVHYWASPLEAKLCANQEVALIGGDNSAGQAAVYLASQGAKVWMLVRRPDLAATMSRYLVDRIRGLSNIEVVTGATVTGLEGHDGMLQAVSWRLSATDRELRRPISHLFCLSVPTRIPTGSADQVSVSTPKVLSLPARMPAIAAIRWKLPTAVCSPSVTCGQNQ